MVATTRWVEYSVSASGTIGDGNGRRCVGTRGYSLATASIPSVFTIGSSNDILYFRIDGVGNGSDPCNITVISGTDLDPRLIARDITEKIHNLGKNDASFDQAICRFENNQFKLYSGTLGTTSAATIVSGTNTAHTTLGWGTSSEVGGAAGSPFAYTGGLSVSGTYNGFFDEVYRVVIDKEVNVGSPSKSGSNYYTGTLTAGGLYNHTASDTYTLEIDCTNGTTMGGGTGYVPKLKWTSSLGDDNSTGIELLYADYWYNLGSHGVMVKFSDAVFNSCAGAWTIACTYPQYAEGSNTSALAGTAYYIWSSTRGDYASAPIQTSSGTFTRVGTRGVYVRFDGVGSLRARDEFYVVCTPPQPYNYNITNLNFGNVTVSTESAVKCVMFEIMSGAVEIGAVKFGLQSHGTFSHHNAGNSDTKFRFGTVGPSNKAGSAPVNGVEWRTSVTASDISSDTPPTYLYATEDNLSVVGDADSSEAIGSSGYCGMTSDPIWVNIRLGASEVGANSSINFRTYFDYS